METRAVSASCQAVTLWSDGSFRSCSETAQSISSVRCPTQNRTDLIRLGELLQFKKRRRHCIGAGRVGTSAKDVRQRMLDGQNSAGKVPARHRERYRMSSTKPGRSRLVSTRFDLRSTLAAAPPDQMGTVVEAAPRIERNATYDSGASKQKDVRATNITAARGPPPAAAGFRFGRNRRWNSGNAQPWQTW